MAIYLPSEGKIQLLTKMVKSALSVDESYYLKLFQNDVTLSAGLTIADFVEADFSGYTSQTLTRANWGTPVVNGSIVTSTYATEYSWTAASTDNTIYGYLIQGVTSGKVLWLQKLSEAIDLLETNIIEITPKISLNILCDE